MLDFSFNRVARVKVGPYDAMLSPQTLTLGSDEPVMHWVVFTTLYSAFG